MGPLLAAAEILETERSRAETQKSEEILTIAIGKLVLARALWHSFSRTYAL